MSKPNACHPDPAKREMDLPRYFNLVRSSPASLQGFWFKRQDMAQEIEICAAGSSPASRDHNDSAKEEGSHSDTLQPV
jgi:hypothetical protein